MWLYFLYCKNCDTHFDEGNLKPEHHLGHILTSTFSNKDLELEQVSKLLEGINL